MLVQPRESLIQRCGWPWNLGTTAAGVVLTILASSLRLDAGVREPDATDSTLIVAQSPAAAPSTPGTVFLGRVRDKETGKPVAEAKVNVRLSVTDRATHNRKTLTEFRQRTTVEGIYRFTITPSNSPIPRCSSAWTSITRATYAGTTATMRWPRIEDARRFSMTRSSNKVSPSSAATYTRG